MLPAFLLSLREGLEIALLVGIVMGALRKVQRNDLNKQVWLGVTFAGIASLGVAILLRSFGASLEGQGEKVFEGITMLLAAGVLTWMIFWMQRQSRMLKGQIEYDVRHAALQTGGKALFVLAFVIVLREGIELSLFLTASAMASGGLPTFAGAVLGLVGAAILGWGIYASTVRLNVRSFFGVTSILLIFFAAGLVAHGVHELNEAGLIPSVVEPLWDSSHVLNEDAGMGLLFKTLFGYNANPSLTEVVAYLGFFLALLVGLRFAFSLGNPVEKISP